MCIFYLILNFSLNQITPNYCNSIVIYTGHAETFLPLYNNVIKLYKNVITLYNNVITLYNNIIT